jgi:hypothetical protein
MFEKRLLPATVVTLTLGVTIASFASGKKDSCAFLRLGLAFRPGIQGSRRQAVE